jgi:hypothetical protein
MTEEKQKLQAPRRPDIGNVQVDGVAGRKAQEGIVVVMARQSNLFDVVFAGHSVGGFANFLHGRQ